MTSTLQLRGGDACVAPLVCIHPVNGRADAYQPFANALDWPGAVLGIAAPEPSPDGYRFVDLANRYCDELDLKQPVVLLGASIGGVIATELCHVIAARGGRIAFLAVLDSRAPTPEMRNRPTDREVLARAFLTHAALFRNKEPITPASTSTRDLRAALRQLGADDFDDAELERRLATFMALVRAFYQHDQRPVPVKLHVFEAAEVHPNHPKPPTLGWDDLAPSIEYHAIPGSHVSLLAARHAESLAKTIARCLPR